MACPIIYINGWPGVGKHTIAKSLKRHLGDDACVVHNHQHIDLAEAILPRSSPDYQTLRRRLRAVLFRSLIDSRDTHHKICIFTDFQSANEPGPSVAQEYRDAAYARECTFIPVILTCDGEENAKRMQSIERIELVERWGKGMLLDTETLRKMRSRVEIHQFGCPEELVLDVTSVTADQAAEFIRRHIAKVAVASQSLLQSGYTP